jgi:glucosamine-6-phosphate deaminase
VGDPRILVVERLADLDRVGADLVTRAIEASPAATIVVAMGRTPMGLYGELAARRRSSSFDLSGVTVFQLDEYLGLGPDDRRSLFGWMHRSFLVPLGVGDDQVVRLPTDGALDRACEAFDRALEDRGGLDLAVLGLGSNGHVGFNEPPSDRDAPTRDVDLAALTIEANARYWGDGADVPTRAVTMGMAALLAARTIVLVVSGEGKRSILRRSLEGPVGPTVPASFLREVRSDVTVIADRAAWGDR